MKQRLVIFTRYPVPGTTKTRLVPVLGPEGAADLQRRMTRHILDVATKGAAPEESIVEVRFEGGTAQKMAALFGAGAGVSTMAKDSHGRENDDSERTDDFQKACSPVPAGPRLHYRPQGAGDLGTRLLRSIEQAVAEGVEQVIIVGADCPGITSALLHEARQQLATADLVIGPATDGGYYLIGLHRPLRELFFDMPWGTDRVCSETRRRARQLCLSTHLLPTLSDVDRPDDLPVWRRIHPASDEKQAGGRLSIIIPTLNEAEELPRTLSALFDNPPQRPHHQPEVLVVDGGSTDETVRIASRAGCRVVESSPPRARQLNTGAALAQGEQLLFLHADTRLPAGFGQAIDDTLNEAGVVGGAFRLHIDAPGWSLRLVERTVDFRSSVLKMPYGDQGLFVRRDMFWQVGGFAELPIMDDFEFVRRVRQSGRIRITPLAATTSARRWRKLGTWRTVWINQKVLLRYHLGTPPERLVACYQQRSRKDRSGP